MAPSQSAIAYLCNDAIALLAFIIREQRTRQAQAVMFCLLDRLGWLVELHVHGPVFVPALPRWPMGKMTARGLANRRMR